MPVPNSRIHDVIIAGAGPVGLFLACELQLAGCTVLLLERAVDPYSSLKGAPFGLRGLTVPTIEALDRRDLLDDLKARATDTKAIAGAHWLGQRRRPGGHFAGIQFFYDQIEASRWPWRLPEAVGSLATTMADIEAVFAARAEAFDVDIRRGCPVEGVETSDTGVAVRAGGETFHAGWLVGCDGGRSAIRKLAGFDFAGTEPEFTGYSVQATFDDPGLLLPGRHYTATGIYTFSAPGTIAMVDFDGGACHRTEPTRAHVEAVLRKVTGTQIAVVALEQAATWTDRAFQATAYRKGRVLLAGDSAHVHSPLGGQGLNLGLGDAMNLGWKLAATIRGEAPSGLLESYAIERMPVGATILDWSRAQVALMRPAPASRALEAIVRDLMATGDGATYFAERVWAVGLRYDLAGAHPLIGRSVPDFMLAGARVNEVLRGGRGLLIDFTGDPALQALAARWCCRIDYRVGMPADRLGIGAALVRPDGIVAWVCEAATDLAVLDPILTRWFGDPAA